MLRSGKFMYSTAMIDEPLLEKIAAYRPSDAAVALLRSTPIALIVGISGAGKDTIINELIKTGEYRAIVSHTTRAPRENAGIQEQDGVDYHFIDLPTAAKMIDEQAFIETKIYSNNIYGTSVAEIQRAHDEHKIAISDVEVKGVAEYAALTPTLRPIFVLPPNYEVWQQRLLSRYGNQQRANVQDIQRRLHIAEDELLHVRSADYFSLVINDNLEQAVQKINELVHAPTNLPERPPTALRHIDNLLAQLEGFLQGKG